MKPRIILVLLGIVISVTVFAQAQWMPLSSPVNENFQSVWITDTSHFYIVSDVGTLLTTNDGGSNWSINSFSGYSFTDICFADSVNGAMVSSSGIVTVFTTNDGVSWQSVTLDSLDTGNALAFSNPDYGCVTGTFDGKNAARVTADGGLTWGKTMMPLIMGSSFLDVNFRDETNGNMVGTGGAFYSTNDGGNTWGMNVSFPSVDIHAVYNFGDQQGVAVGNGGFAFYTVNRWYQHSDMSTTVQADLHAVWGAPGTDKVWAVGDSGTILFMNNYLLGWTKQISGTTECLNDVFVYDENLAVAVGDQGTILIMKLPNSVISHTAEPALTVSPNPVFVAATIKYSVSKRDRVSMRLIDLTGNEKQLLINEIKTPGKYETAINTQGLPNGIYYLQLNMAGLSVVKPLIVLR